MNKLIAIIGIFGVLTIFFLGMGIQTDEPVSLVMDEIDFTERAYPQEPAQLIVVETPQLVVVPETKHYSDVTTSHGKPLLQRTDAGENVVELQELLNQHGANLDIDGEFGDDTRQAVLDFQEEFGLQVDGFAGEQTWGQLLE